MGAEEALDSHILRDGQFSSPWERIRHSRTANFSDDASRTWPRGEHAGALRARVYQRRGASDAPRKRPQF
ncbi:hypothetical protein TRAPUB_3881 [Trametes pubescens]|uniref:Uncharacterized protein n=1 Tax=Trametes pubescens TaxID=154538 RepID=A0A1M2VCA8_TRAPU|nr:hypothetical protein TRAPUB_3881 [Trametes pubescens]